MVRKSELTFGAPARTPKPEDPPRISSALVIAHNQSLAVTALGAAVCLRLEHGGLPRLVEVHTVGMTPAGRAAMSAYEVGGRTRAGDLPGWRLFCFDECFDLALTDTPSAAPRPGYRKRAEPFSQIITEL